MTKLKKQLNLFFVLSLATHIFVMLFFIFLPSFQFEKPKSTKVTWIRLSKGDGGTNTKANFKKVNGLVQSTIRDQKNALKDLAKSKKGQDKITKKTKTKLKYKSQKNKVLSQKRTSKKGGVNLKKRRKQKSSTSDPLAKIDRILNQRKVQLGASQAKKGASGQSIHGGKTGSKLDMNLIRYYNKIKSKVSKEWMIAKQDFSGSKRAKIVVMIDARGNVIRTWYEKQSGDGSFDSSALRAVKNAAPFPLPPVSIRDELLKEGISFVFDPNRVSGKI